MATIAPPAPAVQIVPGLAGFLCEVTGSPVAFAKCRSCAGTRKNPGCPLPAAVIERIVASIRPPDLADQLAATYGAQIGFSVTELLKCSRRKRLEKSYAWYEKPQGLYRMMRGTAVHDHLSDCGVGVRESRLCWTFKFMGQTITLSGQPDVMELRPEGIFVSDYKVTENPPRDIYRWVCSGCGSNTKKDERKFICPNCGELSRTAVYRATDLAQARSTHIMQINLYCLLIEKNVRQVTAALGATGEPPVLGGEVIYLPPTLPMRCPIPYEREATMTFLKDRLRMLLAPDLPLVLAEDDEGKWECGFCSLAEVCASA